MTLRWKERLNRNGFSFLSLPHFSPSLFIYLFFAKTETTNAKEKSHEKPIILGEKSKWEIIWQSAEQKLKLRCLSHGMFKRSKRKREEKEKEREWERDIFPSQWIMNTQLIGHFSSFLLSLLFLAFFLSGCWHWLFSDTS